MITRADACRNMVKKIYRTPPVIWERGALDMGCFLRKRRYWKREAKAAPHISGGCHRARALSHK